MITTRLYGRLGNQMFQIANCIAHALRHGMEYQIPSQTTNPEKWPAYFTHFPVLKQSQDNFGTYRELHHGYTEIPRREQIIFDGYFQSYKYFWDYRFQVFEALAPAFSFINDKGFNYAKRVSIHVRRGDYVELNSIHPPVTIEYLKQAIDYFVQQQYLNFTVYSDDIEWCKENMKGILPEKFKQWVNFKFMDQPLQDPVKDALYDLYTMSKHEHNIISNSTFSYWAAILNNNPYKIVYTPGAENWFGPECKDFTGNRLDVSSMMPPEWISRSQAEKKFNN